MAFFGLFGGNEVTPKKIEKQLAKVKQKYSQPEFRQEAMNTLLAWETPEALDAVLQRFSVVVQSPHWDETEKKWLVDAIAAKGAAGEQALTRFLNNPINNHITFASHALRKMLEKDRYIQTLISALEKRDPNEYRNVQSKQELILALAETGDKAALEHTLVHLDDHGDDVQCTTINAVKTHKIEKAFPRLLEMLSEDLHSGRVLREAAQAASELKLELDPTIALNPDILEDFKVENNVLISARSEH